ncbi:MAG TPA: 4a-hydroxytetrahydrobiopterin dehydratase [Thiolinea sp.]|nr:4a-hydroxytetrahydrobiopterin dehydratase [Thiolinea sp.]
MAVNALTQEELEAALRQLSDWQVVVSSTLAKDAKQQSYELHRVFKFASFEAAMGFMAQATRLITQLDHHPRWENTWRTVSVWLTTWDAGHQPSMLDLQLARQLDALWKDFA